jgi:pentatricopeptide repeat protein
LDLGIEVEYCRWLVRKRNFQPPARAVQNWPWPIRICSLGCFHIEVGEQAVEIAGKSQRKPLNLLKSMLISRNGVEITVLMDRFWPDLDGDAARNAFDLATHRLRKILGHKNAVIVSQGRLMLNGDVVWVDAFAFMTLAETTVTDEAPAEIFRRLLQLYRGAFLADEEDAWMLAARASLRNKFLLCVEQLGDVLQASHDYATLTHFYQRVLEADPLAEQTYRSLMNCLVAQGRHAEAIQVYGRCAEVLAAQLQVKPSPPTQNLHAWLLKQ